MLINNEQLENCPTEFSVNCNNYGKRCNSCAGSNSELTQLHYSEKTAIGSHPVAVAFTQQKKANRKEQRKQNRQAIIVKNSREGRKKEEQIKNKLNKHSSVAAQSTERSGAVFKDGDLTVTIKGVTYNAEIKRRTNNNLFGPTAKEWDKAVKQSVDLFITSSDERGDFICMTLDTFLQITQLEDNRD